MEPLIERIEALRSETRARPITSSEYPDGLTEREVEVLQLLASGKSNREIAEELSVSPGTARFHVSNILGKTGSANRTEAASYARQHNLI